MKKIDILNSALAESGLTAEAVIKSWYEDNQVSAEFLQQLCPVGEKNNFSGYEFYPVQEVCNAEEGCAGDVLLRRRPDISGTDKRQSGFGNRWLCRQEAWIGFGITGNGTSVVKQLSLC